MRRRKFITLLGGVVSAWPVGALAQEPRRTYRLGAVIPAGRESPAIAAFFDEMRLFGFIEGQHGLCGRIHKLMTHIRKWRP